MFFVLSKAIYFLVMPAVLITLAIILAFLFKKRPFRRKLFILAVAMFLLFTNEFIINELLLLWEEEPSFITESTEPYDLAVVFTGMTNSYKSPKDRVHFNKGADRIMQAVHLYKIGKVKKILVSGGSGKLLEDGYEEATILKSVLLDCSVALEDIIIENKAMNTQENAMYSAEIIRPQFSGKRILLITSAFHMRRSEGCLAKEEIEFDTYAVDYYSFDRSLAPNVLIIPSEYAMHKWQKLIHELVGYTVYKMMGYI